MSIDSNYLENRSEVFRQQIRTSGSTILYANKRVAQFLLDRIFSSGAAQNEALQIKRLDCFASFQGHEFFMEALEELLSHPRLHPKSRKILEEVQKQTHSSLLLATLCDLYKFECEPQIRAAMLKGDYDLLSQKLSTAFSRSGETLSHHDKKEVTEAIELLTDQVVHDLKNLKVGEAKELDWGSLNTVTKLWIVKKEDSTFLVYHADSHTRNTMVRSIPCDELTRERIAEVIFSKLHGKPMPALALLGREEKSDATSWLHTEAQEINACAIKGHFRLLRCAFFEAFQGSDKGWEEYKWCAAEIKRIIFEKDLPHLFAHVKKFATVKMAIHQRFDLWKQEIEKGNFKEISEGYLEHFRLLNLSDEQISHHLQAIEGMSSLKALDQLHHFLVSHLEALTEEEVIEFSNSLPDYFLSSHLKALESIRDRQQIHQALSRCLWMHTSPAGRTCLAIAGTLPFKDLWIPYLNSLLPKGYLPPVIRTFLVDYLNKLEKLEFYGETLKKEFQESVFAVLDLLKQTCSSLGFDVTSQIALVALKMELDSMIEHLPFDDIFVFYEYPPLGCPSISSELKRKLFTKVVDHYIKENQPRQLFRLAERARAEGWEEEASQLILLLTLQNYQFDKKMPLC